MTRRAANAIPRARPDAEGDFARRRRRMVERLRGLGIEDERVLAALGEVPRHLFVDEALRARAYGDGALPIGCGQTLSQPYIIARMLSLLALRPQEKVLEIGTGSGYQAALLGRLTERTFTIERVEALAARAPDHWRAAGVTSVRLRVGDGTLGWPEEAPFDAIVVGAASPVVPPSLLRQLAPGGRMAIPVGAVDAQTLRHLVRTPTGAQVTEGERCRFVRLVGAEGCSL